MRNGFFLLYDRTTHRYTIGQRVDQTTLVVQPVHCWQVLGEDSWLTDAEIEKNYRVHAKIHVPQEVK